MDKLIASFELNKKHTTSLSEVLRMFNSKYDEIFIEMRNEDVILQSTYNDATRSIELYLIGDNYSEIQEKMVHDYLRNVSI